MKTKLIGNFIRKSRNEDGNLEITFELSEPIYESYAQTLEKGAYSVIIDSVKHLRTNNQNRLMWALIKEICGNENASCNDTWDMYCEFLRMAKALYTYVSVLKDGVDSLAQAHGARAVQILGTEVRDNGNEFVNCRLFLGSSQMDTKEMGVLIDCILDYAEQLGISTQYYLDKGIKGGRKIKFVIKGKLDGLNEYINACRTNRYKGAEMKKKNERLVMAYILQAVNFGEVYEVKKYPIKLNINWYEPNNKRDIDNLVFATKFIQDSLVRTGILEDDSRKYINQVNHSVFTDKENPRIEVEIL